ncbi:MAG: phosphoglycerate mutase family protein [Bacteroidales bacterium]|jgi:hypothetical protein|nr:phosphoglycerate mutase family protein [Bacteroidales bacterium]
MKIILELAEKQQKKAFEIINDTGIIEAWKSVGADINLVGSLKTGLLVKHRDIDFHIYSDPLLISDSFKAIQKISENPTIKKVEYVNLIDTEEKCLEWHVWYSDVGNEIWQIDMIHILKGSAFDGFAENMAEKILEELTEETRNIILQLKYQTPDSEEIHGIEYYKAVLKDGVKNFQEFLEWRKSNPFGGIMEF